MNLDDSTTIQQVELKDTQTKDSTMNVDEERQGKRKLSSLVWEHFERFPCDNKDEQMAKCLNCGIDYKCPPRNGTSTLWAHIERCYKNLYDVGGDKK